MAFRISLRVWRIFLLFAALQSLFLLFSEFILRSERGTFAILAISPSLLIIGLGAFLLIFGAGWLLIVSWAHPGRSAIRLERLSAWLSSPKTWSCLLLLVVVTFLIGIYFITLIPDITEPTTISVFSRLLPLVIWITGLATQTIIFLIYARFAQNPNELFSNRASFFITLTIIGLFLLGWWWVTQNTYKTLDSLGTGWYSPGVPIIETQLVLAWLAGMVMFLLIVLSTRSADLSMRFQRLPPCSIDILVGILLWLVTIFLWQITPLVPSWFVTEPTKPNYEFYPNSDAAGFDRASQSHLVGEGYGDLSYGQGFVRRPLLVSFLSAFHIIAGQDYRAVVNLQIVLLALLPSLIYYLTSGLHNRISGMIAAVLIMLREVNAIAISDTITASHAKLLMSDLPTQFMLVCLTISAVAWLKRLDRISIYPLICGALLGLATLMRSEAVLLILPLLFVSAFILLPRKRLLIWFKNALLLTLGAFLLLSPWMFRTWRLTGYFTIDSPQLYERLIQRRIRPISDKTRSPAEGSVFDQRNTISYAAQRSSKQSARVPITITQMGLIPSTADGYQSENLTDLLIYPLSYFWHGQIETFLILPTAFRPLPSSATFLFHRNPKLLLEECCSLKDYIVRMPYWRKWDGTFPSQAIIPLILIFLLYAFGISTTWKKGKIIGLIPLILGLFYISVSSVLRFSGGRFILPVDWNSLMYFSIGLAQITTLIITSTTDLKFDDKFAYPQISPDAEPVEGKPLHTTRLFSVAILIFSVGCTLPLFEISIPQRYTQERNEKMLNAVLHSDSLDGEIRKELLDFLTQGGVTLTGRGIYPRVFPPNVGDPGGRASFGPRPYRYIGFYIIGHQNQSIILPIEQKDINFPNGSDVIVFACRDEYGDSEWIVHAVAVFNQIGALDNLIINPNHGGLSCSNSG